MICPPCTDRNHDECRGGTWCDCQHHPTREEIADTSAVPERPTLSPLRWHYGDNARMWCYDCGAEVYGVKEGMICSGCGREEPEPEATAVREEQG